MFGVALDDAGIDLAETKVLPTIGEPAREGCPPTASGGELRNWCAVLRIVRFMVHYAVCYIVYHVTHYAIYYVV